MPGVSVHRPSTTFPFRAFVAVDLAAAVGMRLWMGGPFSPVEFVLRVFLWAIILPIAWPVWLVAWGLWRGLIHFLRGPRLRLSPREILETWEEAWGVLQPEFRERFLARPQVQELGRLPRAAVTSG